MPITELETSVEIDSFGPSVNAAVVGATGGLGRAFGEHLNRCGNVDRLFRLARSHDRRQGQPLINLDLENEETIKQAAGVIREMKVELGLIIVATGILHEADDLRPEKSWRTLSPSAMERAYRLNAIGPAIVAKHFLPLLSKNQKSAFAVLSARVGSIADNRLGGWHSYRASKAGLNMLIKTLSIELARRNAQALCVGLHPGTVDTSLSKPFQRSVPDERLFSPEFAARNLLMVIDQLGPEHSGGVYAWDGSQVPA